MSEAMTLLNRLGDMLIATRAEQQRQYWAFTRTAKGKPVDPAVTAELVWLERQVSLLRNWLFEVPA
jgi:hypothetical protein